MSDTDATANRRLTIRVTEEELTRVDKLQERLQNRVETRAGVNVRVSQKTVILEALEALERYLDDLDRKR